MNGRAAGGPHRPWPLPTAPWVMRMSWHDLCFLHWRVDEPALAPLLPAGLELQTFDGAAWIGVVPFHMTDLSPRGVPRIRRFADFAELNVRTNVTAGGKPGVWFFSLDATQPLAVRVARGAVPSRLSGRADRDRPGRRRLSATAAPARTSARARPSCARATGRPARRCRAGPARSSTS